LATPPVWLSGCRLLRPAPGEQPNATWPATCVCASAVLRVVGCGRMVAIDQCPAARRRTPVPAGVALHLWSGRKPHRLDHGRCLPGRNPGAVACTDRVPPGTRSATTRDGAMGTQCCCARPRSRANEPPLGARAQAFAELVGRPPPTAAHAVGSPRSDMGCGPLDVACRALEWGPARRDSRQERAPRSARRTVLRHRACSPTA